MKRLALITGAARGIGAATTELFAADGWEVVAVDKIEKAEVPQGASYWRVDLADPADVEDLFDRLTSNTTRLDALINNAAIQLNKPMLETTNEEWERVQAINVQTIFAGSKLAHPLLREAGGAIVNVSSVHGPSHFGQRGRLCCQQR